MKKLFTFMGNVYLPLIVLSLFFISGHTSLLAGNGIIASWHKNTSDWHKADTYVPGNENQTLSLSFAGDLYCSSGPGMEATPGGYNYYAINWNGGSGSKGWIFPVNTTGFQNITISFYQRSRIQVGTEIGPRDFKLQYSTNGTSWTDVAGASYTLTTSYQQFTTALPAACNNQATLYFKIVMSSNSSLSGGAIVAAAVSDIADIKITGDEISNLPITDMNLSNTLLADSLAAGTKVGFFTCTDANLYDIHTYSLVAGAGDTHNGNFVMHGDSLKTAAVLYGGAYSIRVRVSDGTNTYIENYTICISPYVLVKINDPNYNYDEWITRVQAGSAIDRSSGMSGLNNSIGYSDYTSDVITVNRSDVFSLTITAHVRDTYGEFIRAYFDWNHDYDFTDTTTGNERVDLLKNSRIPNTDLSPTTNITVPANAKFGITRMRVVIDNYGRLALGGTDDYGEAEDYTVYITPPTITFTDGSSFTPVLNSGTDMAFGRFKLAGSFAGASLTGVTVKLNGARTGFSNIKLWASADASFGGDTQLGSTVAADPGDGNTVSFTFSNPITTSDVYYFLTGDIEDIHTGSIQGVIVGNSSLTFNEEVLRGTITNAALSDADTPLPVELISFTASASGKGIELRWETASEIDNYGFEVERSVAPKAFGEIPIGNENNLKWEKIGFVDGAGNSNAPKQYSFVDANPIAGNVQYRLKQINTNGSSVYYNQIAEVNYLTGVNEKQLPAEFALDQNYPNPFNPTTKIQYAVGNGSVGNNSQSSEQLVSLKVYDILGNEVATLVNEHKAPGYYEVEFSAGSLATGVYIYKLTAGSFTAVKKLILMK